MPWGVVPVIWAAADVFERRGIPVAVVDEEAGVVASEILRVQRYWDGVPVETRISCPLLTSGRRSRIYASPFEIRLVAHARETGSATTRIRVTGEAEAEDVPLLPGERVRCEVRESFRRVLADEIGREIMTFPPRRHRGFPGV